MLNQITDALKVAVLFVGNLFISLTAIDEILKIMIGIVSFIYIISKLVFMFLDRKKK